jgi:hypothetical protein
VIIPTSRNLADLKTRRSKYQELLSSVLLFQISPGNNQMFCHVLAECSVPFEELRSVAGADASEFSARIALPSEQKSSDRRRNDESRQDRGRLTSTANRNRFSHPAFCRKIAPSIPRLPWFRGAESYTRRRAAVPRKPPTGRRHHYEGERDGTMSYRSTASRGC